ncbi:MAG: D-2-hydroxyacid dehydrogenase [Planctomycetaceae bacterium]|jgi:phosphoglycerate dehydrogenase-like enzyme|nr:D-2-hydroxyacid dehydrogenase [Planctomycetaceae bacterium]MBT5597607.1 D-2-hydroxyacid dehydrogenase [Planctomycetaceae bacterium]MBT5884795.1 D-2-hydroxyacid dehydrogenase [Planctomycetaceae bacterium]MBT7256821.1 D-2-hydroxyacid dehydrogenase [Planctomycetaceae bacterium]
MKLVIHPRIDTRRFDLLNSISEKLYIINAASTEIALREIRDAEGFYGKITPDLLAASQGLRWVQSPTASLEHFIFPELADHCCTLTNMRGLFYDVIADHVLMYILMFCRQMPYYTRQQLQSNWAPLGGEEARSDFSVGPGMVTAMDLAHSQLSDMTVGVIGLGSIGAEIASHCVKLGMRVVGVDPYCDSPPELLEFIGGKNGLFELLSKSDFVVIAAPHTPETEGMFNSECFTRMKNTAYLINIGRGAIVPLDDLREALETGQILGAALDVMESEPLGVDDSLWKHPNVIITPHVAACSTRVAERHLETLLENVRRFTNHKPLLNVVNKNRWF